MEDGDQACWSKCNIILLQRAQEEIGKANEIGKTGLVLKEEEYIEEWDFENNIMLGNKRERKESLNLDGIGDRETWT